MLQHAHAPILDGGLLLALEAVLGLTLPALFVLQELRDGHIDVLGYLFKQYG